MPKDLRRALLLLGLHLVRTETTKSWRV